MCLLVPAAVNRRRPAPHRFCGCCSAAAAEVLACGPAASGCCSTSRGGPTGGFPLPDGNGHRFHIAQAICVGSGGPPACRWTAGHRSRVYSEFTVFTRSPLNGGVVRSWTLATRAAHGLVPVQPHGGDKYVGWPPDFYMSRARLLTTDATPARFRSIVAPIAARLRQQENATAARAVSHALTRCVSASDARGRRGGATNPRCLIPSRAL